MLKEHKQENDETQESNGPDFWAYPDELCVFRAIGGVLQDIRDALEKIAAVAEKWEAAPGKPVLK